MARKLTIKQERFCNLYVETGNASEAYRRAYSCGNMKSETVNRLAFDILNAPKITARVKELQDEQKAKSDVTKEEIIRLCADVIRGKVVTDFVEERNGRQMRRAVSKSWAVERLCKMLGFDAPERKDLNLSRPMTIEEARKIIDEL